ncbi:M14 family zinc carboxypeptidase [Salininema proteolyticum]|uniref:M14 family zinc carboxypeptidase n=1 Tax=Salininema proteolyticum TaxID=1607685 RepID=A0ABV8TT50_9ACTN
MRPIRSALALTGTCILVTTGLAAATASAQDVPDGEPVVWEVSGLTPDEVLDLYDDGFDVAEFHDGTADVIGDQDVADELRERGMDPEFHDTVYKPIDPAASDVDAQGTFYGGYKTSDLHFEHVDDVASQYPDLTEVYDIGDSWLKTQGRGGHDIQAICLTAKEAGDCQLSPDSSKPRFTLVSQIHSRELATGEITWRWIDYLTQNYGSDPEVTELMDTTEMWVVPQANPDGVDRVAAGGNNPVLHRKNANDSTGCSGTGVGVDLNRNHSYKWGDASSNPCAETYRGSSPASEPEIQALQDFFGKIHPDQRGPGDNDPAPDDTRDVMISLHAYGNYLIVPWGYSTARPPNDSDLRSLANAQAQHNGYQVGNPAETVGYTASGTTDDYTYGELGIASYTYEIGSGWGSCGGFFPSYSCVDSTFWPANRDALMVAAQSADAPYGGGSGEPEPTECENRDVTESGNLSGRGSSVRHPSSSGYEAGSGTHQVCLRGPEGTDFDLYLEKWSGSSWTTVDRSISVTSDEDIEYSGTAGTYRIRAYSYSGSGDYSVGYSTP